MPRSYYVQNGMLQRDKGLDRGEMLVWTEEQWRDRFLKRYNQIMKNLMVFLALLFIVLFAFILLIVLSVATEDNSMMFLLMLLLISVPFGVTIPIALFVSKWNIDRAPATGLYETGLQITPLYFIPYDEMKRTERKMVGWRTKAEAVLVHPVADKRSFSDPLPRPWSIRMDFLGVEGVEQLERIVAGDLRRKEPPKLVLYG